VKKVKKQRASDSDYPTNRSGRTKPSCGTAAFADRGRGLHTGMSERLAETHARIRTDDTRAEVEVVHDDINELLVRLLAGAVGVHEDGERLSDADGVRELDERAAGEAGVNKRLGDPARRVRGGAVDLRPVLAGEGTTTVRTPAAVGVDDDLATSETGVTLRTADDETTRGLDLRQPSASQLRQETSSNGRGRPCARHACWPG
jgi:hypothetical protein